MRVLMLSHYALPHVGGIESFVHSLSAALRRRGHEVLHVASDAVRPGEPTPDGDGVVRVPAYNFLEDRLGVPWPVFSPGLAGVLAREVPRADVVHAHGMLYLDCVAGLLQARALGRRGPVGVLTEQVGHVPYSSGVLDRVERVAISTVGRAAVRAAHAVVSVNPRVDAELARLAPRSPRAVVTNCIDTELFRPAEADERMSLRRELGWDGRPRVLFVGRQVERKGFDRGVAAAVAGGGSFELVVAGPLPREAVDRPEVTMLGTLPRVQLARLYRAADVLLLPSHGEGFPLAAQEAMASGLPVILGADDAYTAYAGAAGGGLRQVPDDPAATAAAVGDLVCAPDVWGALSERVARYAHATFAPPAVAARYERIYTEARERAGRF
jgi:glycosyltransferase involved in cell wall biosynthesis